MKKSKIIVKILSCCFVIVLIVALLCVNVFAYSSEQPVYDSLIYTPKFDFSATASVGWTLDEPNPYNAPKEFINVPSLNLGAMNNMPNPDYRYNTLYDYYGGSFYGAKVRAQTILNPDDINGRYDVSMVTYNNMYWDEYGTIYSPGNFGNASSYLLQTTPGVIYGFGGNDIGYTVNDTIEFYFLIPQNQDYDFEEEFDPSSYVNLQLSIEYGIYTIYDEDIVRSTRSTVYDESATINNDWLEFYATNYAEDLPLSDDTVVSLDYAVVHCIFYYGRYLNANKYDVYGNDVDELEGLIISDFDIGAKMFIDDSAIDFSYVSDEIKATEMARSYREFVTNTGNVPIYAVNVQSKTLTGVQSRAFLQSIIAESSPSANAFDPNTELDFVTWLGNTIFGVLRVEFIPGISIANILYVITGLGLLFMIIKYFAGG